MTGPGSAEGRPEGADALTQKDIDQLLQGAGGGPARPGRQAPLDVVPYNFLRPPRISKDRRVQLDSIFSRFALSMQSMFSTRLRTPVDVTFTMEQATLSEYVLSIANPCAAFVFNLGGVEGGQGAIDLSTDLAYFIIDRVFGGPGDVASLQRPLTQLERNVARGVVDKLLDVFREAWTDHVQFKPEVVGFESTPDMLQIASLEDNVLVVNLEVRSGQFSSLVAICVPLLSLETFLSEKIGFRGHANRQQTTRAQRATVEAAVRMSEVDLTVKFPPLRLAAREVSGLKVGQIIQTTQPIDGPIELHINGSRRFIGQLGQFRRMLGLRITGPAGESTGTPTRATRGRIQ